jgi:predicted RNA-binding Zn ribbon-like protein
LTGAKESGVQTEAGVGGHLVLNFLNTCGGSGKERDSERLIDWRSAIDWATEHGLLTGSDSRLLEKARLRDGLRHSDLLTELTEFREAAHAVFSAITTGSSLADKARARLEAHIIRALSHSSLCVDAGAPARWTVHADKAGSALIKDRLAVAASELLTQPILSNVRECDACSWLFLDLSRSRSRRWCSMATCGNRAKAQRHYHAARTAAD